MMQDDDRSDGALPRGEPAGEDWSPEEFRNAAYAAVDWVVQYLRSVEDRPITGGAAGATRDDWPERPPERGEPFEHLLEELETSLLPGVIHRNHPGYMAGPSLAGSGPGVIAEWISSVLAPNEMLHGTQPAQQSLEPVVLRWIWRMVGLPGERDGLLTERAAMSNFLALAAARDAATGGAVTVEGLAAPGSPRLRLYVSEEIDPSVLPTAIALGLGAQGVRTVATDAHRRLDLSALDAAVREDRAAGWKPFAAIGMVGTRSYGSVDPISALAAYCRGQNLWLHVDASRAGLAAMVPEKSWCLEGCEEADSLVLGPDTWLYVPMEASPLFVREASVLGRAFGVHPRPAADRPDLAHAAEEDAELARRLRALKIYWTLRTFGAEGLRRRVGRRFEIAREVADRIRADSRFELLAPVQFATVCFRAVPSVIPAARRDHFNERLLARVNATGKCFLGSACIRGRAGLRLVLGNLRTQHRNAFLCESLVRRELDALLREKPIDEV